MNVVGTSMPRIIADIGGTQATFTWVVMATSLSSAISTPIWGKLADLMNKKVILQAALVVFTIGTIFAGMATEPNWLIGWRIVQGLGVGGLGVLGQIVLAEVLSPRERGKYMGIMGAIMAVATVGGPLIGGLFTDTIGWRWNFYVAVPVAIVAILMLQFTLNLPAPGRKIKIDYAGAVLLSAGFSSLLIWVTLAGTSFEWLSWQSYLMVGAGIVILLAAIIVELKVEEPLVPLTLFKNRTFTMSVIASVAVGIGMFATAVYLGQYMQIARGRSVIESSLLTMPMMLGVLGSSTVVGQLIIRRGKWKSYVVAGAIALLVGLVLMAQMRSDTSFWYIGVSMFVLGCGVGMTMQNLVLVVQNTVNPNQMGAASSAVTFFRTLGGSAGMSVMGTVLAYRVTEYLSEAFAKLQLTNPEALEGSEALLTGSIPNTSTLTPALRAAVEDAYGHAIGDVFLIAAPIALIAIIAAAFLPNIPLSTQNNAQRRASKTSLNTGQIEVVDLGELGEIDEIGEIGDATDDFPAEKARVQS
ncbi:MAG: MFS transporter, partial [Microbacteriaceae bacterium]|nr:MFS transporter [Microbacteriaceae bacterium]